MNTDHSAAESAPDRVDFALIPILDETYDALVRILSLAHYEPREGYLATWGSVVGRDGDRFTVVVAQPLDRENLAAETLVDSVIRGWQPDNLLVVDIGGGVSGRDSVALGDVVVHTVMHYYDFSKVDSDGLEIPRHTPLPAASSYLRELSRRERIRREDSWHRDVAVRRPTPGTPVVRPGEILSGGALLSDGERLRRLLCRHDKVIAVEMEGAGAGRAVLDSGLRNLTPEFLVVRGISDFCNSAQITGQAMRDRWRRYAAEAAAAHAAAIVREADPRRGGREGSTRSHDIGRTSASKPQAVAAIGQLPLTEFDVQFDFEGERLEIAALAEKALELRRLVVLARAGAGKTVAAKRALLAHMATHSGYFIGRAGWTREFEERLSTSVTGAGWRANLDVILRGATVDVTVEELEHVAKTDEVLLVIDGLNASSAPVAAHILDVLDDSVRHLQGIAIIVTDRNVTRYPPGGQWAVAHLDDLDEGEAAGHVNHRFGPKTWPRIPGSARRLLISPFFLDLALRGADVASYTRSSALEDFITHQAQLAPATIEETIVATAAALQNGSRTLPAGALSDKTRTVLTESGIVSEGRTEDVTRFTHDLFRDYFASLDLVRKGGDWRPRGLDAVTFSGDRWRFDGLSADTESFDAITLAGEQMPRNVADGYLRAVYDWNWRAAIDCLAATDPEDGPFSTPTRIHVLALLNERRSDPVDGTRHRAAGLLGRLPDPLAQRLASSTVAESREIFSSTRLDDHEPLWLSIYRRPIDQPWSRSELQPLSDEDTLLGWTVSYVLKRTAIAEQVTKLLIGLYHGLRVSAGATADLKASVRWRVVHSLAAGSAEEALDVLIDALDYDPYPWVRWGAARSVTEFAARSGDPRLTSRAIDALIARATQLPESVAQEIAWASQFHGAASHFPVTVRPLLELLSAGATSQVAQARWANWMSRFDRFWLSSAVEQDTHDQP